MDNMNEHTHQDPTEPDLPSLGTKVSLLERQLAEQQDRLRDYEKSLVERIADVDDDRRTTASKLQRAWQTQREEIDDRLRRQTRFTLGAIFVFALLLAVVQYFLYRQIDSGQQPVDHVMTEIKQELNRLSAVSAQDDSLHDELARLSAAIGDISTSLGRLDREQGSNLKVALDDERKARNEDQARLDSDLERLEAEQKRFVQEIESLRETLRKLQAASADSGASGSTSEPEPEPKSVPGDEAVSTVVEPPADGPVPPGEGQGSEDETTAARTEETEAEGGASADGGTDAAVADAAPEVAESVVIGDRTHALQLIGFFSLDDLRSFAEREDLPARLYYRQDTYRGRPWFALIHSLHDSYAAAEEERSRLSPSLVALDPWIRPLRAGDELEVLQTPSERP